MKLCVIFPGIGYTTDRPLLYYSGKLAVSRGFELVRLDYHDLPGKVKGNRERMKMAFDIAVDQTMEQLKDIEWDRYDEIVFIGKSIGTAVAAQCGNLLGIKVTFVYLTPLVETFLYTKPSSGIAFHGNSDPWAVTDEVIRICKDSDIPLHIYEGANHSLETGDVRRDIENCRDVIMKLEELFQE